MLKNVALLESIIHIEDLPAREFIREIKNINSKIITEKLDGANLWFGVDEKGFYTSREGKNSKQKRFYQVTDYPVIANYNGFRAAHLALEKAKKIILKYFQPGDAAEIEVLFGRQPNTVTYGEVDKNYIVILRPVSGTSEEKVKKLSSALNNQEVTVQSTVVSSFDGNDLQTNDEMLRWKFASVRPLKGENLDLQEVNGLIQDLENFLQQKNENSGNYTNEEVAEISLNKIEKDKRDAVKAERERVKKYILEKFKLPIKEILLSKFVRKIKPMLQDANLAPSEDIGVEGVVLRDPDSDDQVKIVDRDVFTAINFFNSTVRAQVSGTVKTTDQDAPIELRGGAFGQAKIRIANLLGSKDLALTSGLNKIVLKFKSEDVQKTADNIAQSLNIQNFDSIKRKTEAILENSIREINEILTTFKAESDKYILRLKSGKEIGISPSVMKRTLTAFAETKKDISTIISGIRRSANMTELVMALYGTTIEKVLNRKEDTTMKEQATMNFSILKHITENGEGTAAPATSAAVTAGGGEAPQGQEADTTKAGAIAPYPYRLLNGKVVIRRKRNFEPLKKFKRPANESLGQSLIKMIVEIDSSQNKKSSNVDDTSVAKTDVVFNNLRNMLNSSDINAADVMSYLNRAHELDDEVDTIAFGLELDDGKIVKVYVDALKADDFEKALGEMLGKEDDIEEVINDLAQKYNIIDVVWPEELENAEQTAAVQADELDSQGTEVTDKEEDLPSEIDTTLNKPDENEEMLDNTEAEISPEKYKNLKDLLKGEKESSDQSENEEDSEKKKDSKPNNQYSNLKKLLKNEENDMGGILSQFKYLVEEKKKEKKLAVPTKKKDAEEKEENSGNSAELNSLLDMFPAKQDKAVITLMVNLGAPIKILKTHVHILRTNIELPAERYLKNASFRMWVKKFLSAVTKAGKVEEDFSFDKRLQTKYQHLAYNILNAIGLPSVVEKLATKDLLAGIRKIGNMATENNDVRLNLVALAEELGVADETRSMTEPQAPIKEQVQMADSAMRAKETVLQFVKMFGIDTSKNISVDKQLERPLVGTYLRHLGSSVDNLNRLDALMKRMQKLRMATESQDLTGSSDVVFEQDSNWIFAYLASSGMNLRSGSMSIKLDSDEAEKLKNAFVNEQEETIVSKNGTSYRLVPSDDGFQIVEEDDENATDIFTSEDIQQILSLME